MKKIVLVFLVAILLCAIAIPAVAETETMGSIVNGTLIVDEVTKKETMRIRGVPDDVSVDDAYRLVTGQVANVVINNTEVKTLLGWPVKKKETISNTVVSYDQCGFRQEKILEIKRENDWFITVFAFLAPFIGILYLGIVNQLGGNSGGDFFAFCVIVLLSVLTGASIGTLANLSPFPFVGLLAGVAVGAILGFPAGMFACGIVPAVGKYIGLCVGGIVGGFATILGRSQEYEVIWQYMLCLLAAMITSFIIAKIARAIRKRRHSEA